MAVNIDPVLNFNRVAPIRDPRVSTFAVMDFGSPMSPEGQIGAAGVSAADTFYISLSQRNVRIIERERIKQIAAEQELVRESRVISDQEKAQRIGRLAGADYIIFGAVTEYKSEIRDVQLGMFIPDNEKQRYAADCESYQRASAAYQQAMANYSKEVRDYNRNQALLGLIPLNPVPQRQVVPPDLEFYLRGMRPPGPEQVKSLEQWEDETTMRGERRQLATVASIGLTSRVIDVRTGLIVWVGQGAKRHLQLQEGMQILINKLVETVLLQADGSAPPKKP
jgi:curli biogenesis system outer membrane secretion channel CsgG